MEVALARCPVSAQRHGDRLLAAELCGVGHPYRVEQLGCQRGRRGCDPVSSRVVPRVPVTLQQDEDLDWVDAASHDCRRVTVGREEPVLVPECEGCGDLAGLLSV